MSYQTIQYYDASSNNKKSRLIASAKHLSWKVMITFSVTIFLRKWLLGASRVTLIGALTLSGCTSEHSSEQGKQTPQEKEGAATKPVHKEVGEASWYGPGFQGRETSSGEIYDQKKMTAAHPSLPMGTKAEVTNLENDKKVEVRINDRGPYADNRVIDLSSAAANKLKMKEDGTAQVKIEAKSAKKKSRTVQSGKTKKKPKKAIPSKKQ
ncbi:MAG: septal ring lytic transglycosylase RlpA family protein [Methylobacter sp.]|uniref:septal ring lytic transglycosylase RlpA family protein n=1 Tax=Methylobacter sp. TaxID=2051955 RepID=UPI00272F5820|nr:septal ring lytic transglycosylase RlpA family protein [Methylobacter sp.]MDP1667366.1 septal ring lytic transglycosylase RlpA family protein [Methylobacter sp.]MDP1970633.1 septal ring lytic transglycosylase RlpA family protein [Methylobacter sp.]